MILVAAGHDRYLERYWANRRLLNWPERVAALGLIGATSPNYSFFKDAPRPDIVFNRRRILITAGELSAAGVPMIPHLNAQNAFEQDWIYWENVLRQQTELVYIAKEFQTGLRHVEEGRYAIWRLARLQERVGRQICPIIIGGLSHINLVAQYFDNPVFVESTSFMKTVNRQRARLEGSDRRWDMHPMKQGEALDELLAHNISVTESNVLYKWRVARREIKSHVFIPVPKPKITPKNVDNQQLPLSV